VLNTAVLAEPPAPMPMFDLLTPTPDFSAEPQGQTLEAVQRLISRKLDQLGLFASHLSIEAGKNQAYLNQFLGRGKPRVLPEEVVEVLAKHFKVERWKLRTGGYKGMDSVKPDISEDVRGTSMAPSRIAQEAPAIVAATNEDLRRVQEAAASETRQAPKPAPAMPRPVRVFMATGDETTVEAMRELIPLYRLGAAFDVPMAMMPPLPAQHRTRHAFAVSMTTDAGMLRRGNIVYCVQDAPLYSGDTVVVIREGRVEAVAELVDQAGDVATLRNGPFADGIQVSSAMLAKVVGIDLS